MPAAELDTALVIATCLREVERSIPHTAVLIGNRYGWRPPAAVLDQVADLLGPEYDWLRVEGKGKSITHLEIMTGILRVPRELRRCRVYLRDPDASCLPPDATSAPEDAEDALLAAALREELLAADGVPCEVYRSPEELSASLSAAFSAMIEADHPLLGIHDDPMEQARFDHLAVVAASQQVYVALPGPLERLREAIAAGQSVVVVGPSGSGKSSLLSHVLSSLHRDPAAAAFSFIHFTGRSSHEAHHVNVMHRVIWEIRRWTRSKETIPTTSANLAKALPGWLATAGEKALAGGDRGYEAKAFVFLDALNQLQGEFVCTQLRRRRQVGSPLPVPS